MKLFKKNPLFITKIRKQLILLLSSAVWVLSAQDLLSQHTLTLNDVEFDPDAGAIVSYKWPSQAGTSIIIPDSFNGVPVTTIKATCFLNPRGLVEPGSGLTEVTIPNSVTVIGDYAFSFNHITNLSLGNGVVFIGRQAFMQNNITGTLVLPNSTLGVDNEAFQGNRITGIQFSENLTEIDTLAFAGNLITVLTLPEGVEYIRVGAFAENLISELHLPQSLRLLGGFRANKISSLTVPSHVTEIGDEAFQQNPLISLTIENGVEHIGQRAFANRLNHQYSPALKSGRRTLQGTLNIPPSVKDIGYEAFYGNDDLVVGQLVLNEGLETIGEGAFASCNLTGIEIPSTVKSIGKGAFRASHIESVTLHNGLEEIKAEAFQTNNIIQVTIPGTVKIIDERAFYNNMQMQHITLNEGVEEIGIECFSYNQELQSLTLPHSLNHICKRAFFNTFFVKIPLPHVLGQTEGKTFSHWVYYDNTPQVYNTAHKVETIGGDVDMSEKGFLALFVDTPTGVPTGNTDCLTYTNPVTNGFTVNLSANVRVHDVQGRFVRSFALAAGQTTDLSELPRGLYLFVIDTAGTRTMAKIVKL